MCTSIGRGDQLKRELSETGDHDEDAEVYDHREQWYEGLDERALPFGHWIEATATATAVEVVTAHVKVAIAYVKVATARVGHVKPCRSHLSHVANTSLDFGERKGQVILHEYVNQSRLEGHAIEHDDKEYAVCNGEAWPVL